MCIRDSDSTWTAYKVKGKAMGQEVDADVKVWMSKDAPMGMVKMEMTANTAGQKIDLTKPFDPTKVGGGGGLPPGTDVKVEKGKEGKEKIKVGGKEYDSTWTTYKVKGKAMGQEVDAEVKVWMSKAAPMGMVKMEMTAAIAKMEMKMTMELSESGNKKP